MASSSAFVEDKRWVVLSVVCLVLSLGLPSFAMRVFARLQGRQAMTVDDGIMMLAGVLWLGHIVCQIAAGANGFGAHAKDLPKDSYYYVVGTAHNGDVVEALRFWYICTLLHVLTTCIVRINVGLTIWQYATSKPQRWTVAATVTISILVNIAFFFLLIFQCTPISAFWSRNRADTESFCSHTRTTATWFALTATNTLASLVLTTFPAAALIAPSLPWKKRAAIAVPTLFAAAATATSATQIALVPTLRDPADQTYTASTFIMLALLTPSLALVAVNIATLGPWLKERGGWDTSAVIVPPERRTWRRRRPAAAAVPHNNNVMRGGEGGDDEAVLDAAVREGMARLEEGRG